MSLLPLDGLLLCHLVTSSTIQYTVLLGPIYTTGWRERTWMEVCCQRNQCDNNASTRALDVIQGFFFFLFFFSFFTLRQVLRVLKSHIIWTDKSLFEGTS